MLFAVVVGGGVARSVATAKGAISKDAMAIQSKASRFVLTVQRKRMVSSFFSYIHDR